MEKTLYYYKNQLKDFEKHSWNIAKEMLDLYPDRTLYIRNIFNQRWGILSPELNQRRKNKFLRDNIRYEVAVNCPSKIYF